MTLFETLRAAFERLMEWIVIALVVALTALVIAGAAFRYAGHALDWYDEVAEVGLVWLTYYGAALAALRGAHIGVAGLVNALPPRWRVALTIVAEGFVFLFFGVLAVTGFEVLDVLQRRPSGQPAAGAAGDHAVRHPDRRHPVHDRRGLPAADGAARRHARRLRRSRGQGSARTCRPDGRAAQTAEARP